MRVLLTVIAAATLASPATAGDYRLVDLDSVDFRYQEFSARRDPYTPTFDEQWKYRAALDWNLNLLKYGFWDNSVHTEGLEDGRVKTVGWHWFFGFRIPPLRMDVFHEHHSQHVMDEHPTQRDGSQLPNGYRKFPVEDSVGVRFRLYGKSDR